MRKHITLLLRACLTNLLILGAAHAESANPNYEMAQHELKNALHRLASVQSSIAGALRSSGLQLDPVR
jgi:hypothetical protein